MHHKAFNIAKSLKYDGYACRFASMGFSFFDKRSSGKTVKNKIISNKEIEEELYKPSIIKFKKRKVCSTFIGNILSPDLGDIQLISNLIKEFFFNYVALTFIVNIHCLFI